MKRSFLNIFIIFSLAEFSLAQHDNRYDPFDWIMYLQLGAITSITEGFRYFYIGTEMGGVVRVQSIGQQLDDSITQTQGLKSNEISDAVSKIKKSYKSNFGINLKAIIAKPGSGINFVKN